MPGSCSKKIVFTNDDTPRKIKLNKIINEQKNKLRNKTAQISKLKGCVTRFKTRNTLRSLMHSHKFTSKNSRAIVTMQLKKKRTPWTSEEKNLALTLFYKSPAAYKFLRLQNINLPGPSTIRRWIGESKFLPGFSRSFFNHIQKKFENKSNIDKVCSISFDEIYIKEFLEYSKDYDFIEGFEDFGHYGRSKKTANSVMVFMARGIYTSWKFPVAYFLAHSGVNHKLLKNLIVDVIAELLKIGLCPKMLVCDQGTNNQSALKSLGINEKKPFFFVEENKIFSIFDVPHLFKSIRNNLIGSCFKKGDDTISFSDIAETYQIDKKNTKSRALLKITDAHINPSSFQKMRVKLAVQLLSHTMASTIRTCIGTKQLLSKTANNTAEFIEFVNKLFDCLNSRTLFSKNAYSCALSDTGIVKPFLIEASTYFENVQKIKNGKTTTPPCFKGLTQTINGILYFFEEEKLGSGIAFVLTNRLNQDALENLFSVIRQKGGYNKNPTARTIRTSIRSTCIFSLCTSKGANCEDIDNGEEEPNNHESILLSIDQSKINENSSDTEESLSISVNSTSTSNSSNEEYSESTVSLEDCSVTYFAGYLAFKCIKKFNCKYCECQLVTEKLLDEKNQLLILNKNYSSLDTGLKAPTKDFNNIIDRILNIFEKKFDNLQHRKKIRQNLTQRTQNCDIINTWININTNCVDHKLYIINLLLICKIFKKTQLYATTSKLAKIEKLKILSHV